MFKLIKLFVLLMMMANLNTFAAIIIDSVELGPTYQKEVYYNFNKGTISELDFKDWDIAFETGTNGGILLNGAKGLKLWIVPNKNIEDFSTFSAKDTVGMDGNWATYLNSDSNWSIGAFNANKNGFENDGDFGWGAYSVITHIISGTNIFVIKLSNTEYKKFYVESLAAGEYSFTYANLDGTEEGLGVANKKSATGKNFVYFSFEKGSAFDREPLSKDWHLLFGKYETFVLNNEGKPSPYVVTGVRQNKFVRVAKIENVNPETEPAPSIESHLFSTTIGSIGHNWKTFNMSSMEYELQDNWVYFVSYPSDDTTESAKPIINRLYFTKFEGMSTGKIFFGKEEFPASIIENNGKRIANFAIYPSVISNGDEITLSIDKYDSFTNANVEILALDGRVLSSINLDVNQELFLFNTGQLNLSSGMYFIKVTIKGKSSIEKFIVK